MPYSPDRNEYVVTGVFGVCLYVAIAIQGVFLLFRRGIKLKTSRLFFYCIIVMCALELPRYLELAIQGDYDSRVCYCFHILGGIAFFAAFSIVAHQWSGLLSLASYFKVVYGFQGLVAVNIVYGVVDICSIGLCLASPSLQDYFVSPGFELITLIEAVRNVVYSGILAYFGVSLVCRFAHYSAIDSHPVQVLNPLSQGNSAQQLSSPLSGQAPQPAEEPTSAAFHKAALRLSFVLVVATVCYLLRAIMLIVKVSIINNENKGGLEGGDNFFDYSSPTFPMFGFLWFVCTDFVPRGIPSIVFMALMAKGRGVKRSSDGRAGGGGESLSQRAPVSSSRRGASSSARIASQGSSVKPFALGQRSFFSQYHSGEDEEDGSDMGEYHGDVDGEGEEFQFVRLAGDERENTAHGSDSSGDGRSASELASQELRGELTYLTDEDDDGQQEQDFENVLIAAAFASQGQGQQSQSQSTSHLSQADVKL